MRGITLFAVDRVAHLVQPDEFDDLTMSSPAVELFTDFRKHHPLTIEGSTPAVDAQMLMRKAHVKIILVVDSRNEFIGTLNMDDLNEERFLIMVANGERLQEITVRDMMCPKHSIPALDLEQLRKCSIDDLVTTLKRSGQPHCLVVDRTRDHIRGYISANEVARRLHIPIKIERIPTFVDIFSSVRQPTV
ncbi:CBS domain-containing protein [Pseudohongiella sp. O18]|uniref:CBS domain-containing protein n=1 Tax=Pseudohongiella sp. O18 TaxID=2904248 RepID=UPI001F2245EB|nr:CBS domain-containing protein [Pseudohongiella sp. O18]